MCMRDVQVANDAISLSTEGAWLLGGHFRFLLPRNFRLPICLSQWRCEEGCGGHFRQHFDTLLQMEKLYQFRDSSSHINFST